MLISLFRKKPQKTTVQTELADVWNSLQCITLYISFSAKCCTDDMKIMFCVNTQNSQIKGKHLGISFLNNQILSSFPEEKLWFLVTTDFRLTKKDSWIPFHSIMFTLCTTSLSRFCQIKTPSWSLTSIVL